MNVEDIKIGYWYTWCCRLDLKQIEDNDEKEKVVNDIKAGWPVRVWKTKEEALLELPFPPDEA